MSNTAPASTYTEKVLDFVQVTGAIMEKTAALVATKEAQDKKVAALIPQAVKALLDNERIEPHQKEAAEKVLRDPAKALEILIKTAAHRNDAERARLGQPVPANGRQKTAGSNYSSLSDGYVGRRSSPGEKESDRAFKAGLGVA
jgi:hypothetical protein